MSILLRPYIVKQGDYLLALASAHGFDAESVWRDPKNAALREARAGDGNVLMPGDVLHIPQRERKWHALTVGAVNSFAAPVNRVHVATRFTTSGSALKSEPYVIEGADITPGNLDEDGLLEVEVSTDVSSFRVIFPERHEAYVVRVGNLDPAHERSGLRTRLGMLGLYGRGVGTCADEEGDLEVGLRLFQHAARLEVTGALDDATHTSIVETFGR